ncbi:MAG TPA: apolipoprotein N-acyltransferase [Burkholderiaceae bacterium]
MPPAQRAPDRLGRGGALRVPVAFALGALHAASFSPPFAAWWLQLAALAALVALLAPAPGAALGRRWLALFAFGLGWFATGLAWLHTSMHVYGGMPWALAALAVVLFAAYLAVFPVLALALAQRLTRAAAPRPDSNASRLAYALAVGGAWGASEWLRGTLFTGFPWLAIGYAQVDGPLAGFAPWVGVYGVSAIAAALATLAAAAIRPRVATGATGAAGKRVAAAGTLVPIVLVLAAGAALARLELAAPSGDAVSVRLVQGNVPQQMKFDPRRAAGAMQDYAEALARSPATLTILPETAWIVSWDSTPPEIAQAVAAGLAGSGRLAAIGMPLAGEAGAQRARGVTNSVALLGARPGAATQGAAAAVLARYDKRHLVPFGEFIPTGFAWFVRMMEIPLGEFARGAPVQAPFRVAGQRFAFNVCYEDLFGEEIAAQVRGRDGATVLVNVSNLAWFGDSQALPQHLAIARMRSLETARPMLRATNTGVTAAIDHRGRVLGRLEHARAATLDARVQGTTGLTAYARWGNLTSLAAAGAMLALAFGILARRRGANG